MTKPTPDPPTTIATIVLPTDALRDSLVAALAHPTVIAALADALAARGASPSPTPRFMSVKEYAVRARISPRTLTTAQQRMIEGVHFSRTGRRIRFHVAEADEFLSAARGAAASAAGDAASLIERARAELERRAAKPARTREKCHAS
jgi:hypothetical protein